MTKVDLNFRLRRPLGDDEIMRLGDLPKVYGLHRVRLDPGGQNLVVEFDATRLTPSDVEAELARVAIPILPLG
jgi:hypothetical protein